MRGCALILIALLAGCAGKPRQCPTTPVTIEVPVPVREPVPAALSAPVPDPVVQPIRTVGDAVRAAAAREAALRKANARLAEIQRLHGSR